MRYATRVTTPTGVVYISASSKEELEAKRLQLKGAPKKVSLIDDFNAVADAWLTIYKKPKLRESSYATLKITTDNHVKEFFGGSKVSDISPIQVHLFTSSISHLSKSAQTKCIQYARSIFDVAVENGVIEKSPFSRTINHSAEEPEEQNALTNDQAKALLEAVKGTRAYLFCLIALSTGMRRGEILGLMWDDIDWERKRICVKHNKSFAAGENDAPVSSFTKTAAGRRDIPIPATLFEELKNESVRSTSPFVIKMNNGQSLTRSSFHSLWKIVETRDLGFEVHPHLLRHTYCTTCIEAGMAVKDVQHLMGHATPEMTMRVYAHYREQCRSAQTAAEVNEALDYL